MVWISAVGLEELVKDRIGVVHWCCALVLDARSRVIEASLMDCRALLDTLRLLRMAVAFAYTLYSISDHQLERPAWSPFRDDKQLATKMPLP